MFCSTGCEKDVLWTKKEAINMTDENTNSSTQSNISLAISDYENQTFAKKSNESGNIFINRISHNTVFIEPKNT